MGDIMMRKMVWLAAASVLSATICDQVSARAVPQQSGAQASADVAGAQVAPEAGLTDIVVTAQRREQNLQNVAITVTAVSGDVLIERGVYDISQLGKFVPGFDFQLTGNDLRPAMRGVRTDSIDVNADPTIGYFVDGIYQARTSQASVGFVDVARVEVQRGPQGTLF